MQLAAPRKKEEEKPNAPDLFSERKLEHEEKRPERPKQAAQDLFAERRHAHEEVIKQRPDAVGFFIGKKKDFGESALLFEESSRIEKAGREGFEKSVKIELEKLKGKKQKKKGKRAPAKKRKEKDVPPKE